MRQRLLFVHRYFYPDTPPCAHISRIICNYLAESGYSIRTVTSHPSYLSQLPNTLPKSLEDGDLSIRRLWLKTETNSTTTRIINSILTSASLVHETIFFRPNLIIVTSIPPVLTAFIASIAGKLLDIQTLYFVMDIHPEIGRITQHRTSRLFYPLLYLLESITCLFVTRVIVHSDDMKQSILKRPFIKPSKLTVIPNPPLIDSSPSVVLPKTLEVFHPQKINIIYAGNIGKIQDLSLFLQAMSLSSSPIRLIIVGEGNNKSYLRSLSDELGLDALFLSYQQPSITRELLKRADYGLISLSPHVINFAFPSKLSAYLEASLPSLAILETSSELSRLLNSANCGFSAPQNISEITRLLDELPTYSDCLKTFRSNAYHLYLNTFSTAQVLRKWKATVDQLISL